MEADHAIKAFARALRAAADDLTAEQASVQLGCGLGTYYAWLRGERVPRSAAHIRNVERMGVPKALITAARAAQAVRLAA